MIIDFLFFGIGLQVVSDFGIGLLLSFILSLIVIVVLQQKIVDLIRQIGPEKQASIYDNKFKEKRLSSCDENEQRQIGQASYKAFVAVNNTCIILWSFSVMFLILAFSPSS